MTHNQSRLMLGGIIVGLIGCGLIWTRLLPLGAVMAIVGVVAVWASTKDEA